MGDFLTDLSGSSESILEFAVAAGTLSLFFASELMILRSKR